MDHHHDAQLFLASWAKRTGMRGCSFEAHKVVCESVDHTFDQPAFAGFVVAEKQVAAFALDVQDLGQGAPIPAVISAARSAVW